MSELLPEPIIDLLLSAVYLLSLWAVLALMWQSYRQQRFSFHLIFSLIYVVTFFGGLPFSMAMKYGFNAHLPEPEMQFFTLASATIGYLIYFLSYQFLPLPTLQRVKISQHFAKCPTQLTACLLGVLAVGCLLYFISLNGLLLFRLEKYSQIFSPLVSGVGLKRFFYFFLVAWLIAYFCSPSKKMAWAMLLFGVAFGGVSYLAVGGTRANIALAVAFFLLIRWHQWGLSLKTVLLIGSVGVLAMFLLALARYRLDVQGPQALLTFLYLTRDTFSPWENVARIFASEVEFQGLMPIVRDFYVYIPQSLWADRPDIAWNTANYFTKIVLGNQSGLAMSPTLLGAFYIMGGVPLMAAGMAMLGILLRVTDRLFAQTQSPLVQAYCLGNLFNLIVLVREGADAFVSRFVFFSVVFFGCWAVAYLLSLAIGKHDE